MISPPTDKVVLYKYKRFKKLHALFLRKKDELNESNTNNVLIRGIYKSFHSTLLKQNWIRHPGWAIKSTDWDSAELIRINSLRNFVSTLGQLKVLYYPIENSNAHKNGLSELWTRLINGPWSLNVTAPNPNSKSFRLISHIFSAPSSHINKILEIMVVTELCMNILNNIHILIIKCLLCIKIIFSKVILNFFKISISKKYNKVLTIFLKTKYIKKEWYIPKTKESHETNY